MANRAVLFEAEIRKFRVEGKVTNREMVNTHSSAFNVLLMRRTKHGQHHIINIMRCNRNSFLQDMHLVFCRDCLLPKIT